MARGPAPQWKAKAPHTIDARPYFLAAMNLGFNVPLLWTGIKSREDARNCIRGLYNNGHRNKPRVSMPMPEIIEDSDGTFTVKFRLVDKQSARAHQVAEHGTDRSQWAYDPRERGRKGS